MSQSQPLEKLNFEAALAELEGIVRSLESGKAPLEESISAYERGVALKNHCEKKLAEARLKIEKITLSPDGTAGTEPFNVKE
ncbi:MAG TPA: exodeoxyribonuclease VII small subunit [Micavibrio sp.]|nr:exodeoxyribonuclease VII small subunit [Micavibrio sp.]